MRRLTKAELLEGVEDVQESKLVAYNTVSYTKKSDDGRIYVRFYDTDIIVYEAYHIVLNSGHSTTKITKNRINDFQNVCYIKQVNSKWLVATTKGTIPFFDGMKISNDGVFIN